MKYRGFLTAFSLLLFGVWAGFQGLWGNIYDPFSSQPARDQLVTIQPRQMLSQEIPHASGGFNSLTLYFAAPQKILPWQKSPVVIHLFREKDGMRVPIPVMLQRQSLPLGKLTIHFFPQAPIGEGSYWLELENPSNETPFAFWGGSNTLSADHPVALLDQTNQAATLTYHTGTSLFTANAFAHFNSILPRVAVCFLITFITLAIGSALSLTSAGEQSTENRFFYALGIGLIVVITLAWLMSRFAILPGSPFSWILLFGPAGLLIAINILSNKTRIHFTKIGIKKWGLVFLVLVSTILFRAYQFKILYVPAWVDGLNHYDKVSTIIQNGALIPGDIYPIAYHLISTYIHQGLHSSVPEAMLIAGLWISVFSSLSIYPLAQRLLQSQLAAWLTVIIYSLVTPFPTYLVSWSRFPYLLALGFLALACDASLEWVNSPRKFPWKLAMLILGIALTHYGTIIHWVAFSVSVLLYSWITRSADTLKSAFKKYKYILLILIPMGIVLGIQTISLFRMGIFQAVLQNHALAAENMDHAYTFWLTFQNGGGWVWLFALLSLLVLIKMKSPLLLVLPGWMLILAGLNVLQQLILNSIISSWMNWIINLSMTLSLLSAWGMARLLETRKFFNRQTIKLFFITALLLLGICTQADIVNPATILFNQPDLEAMQWISANTPPASVFAVKSFVWGQIPVPADAGGWIPALTDRKIIWPFTGQTQAEISQYLQQNQINYLYLSPGSGDLNPAQLDVLRALTKVVYNRGDIQIWLVSPQP